MPRLKVAIVAPFPPSIGGMAQLAEQLATGFEGFGWEIRRVVKPSRQVGTHLYPLFLLRLLFAVLRSDAVHVVSSSGRALLLMDLPAMVLARVAGRVGILNFVGGGVESWARESSFLQQMPFNKASRVVVPTERFMESIRQVAEHSALQVIPNPARLEDFLTLNRDDPSSQVLLAAKGLERYAGVDLLILALNKVREVVPSAVLHVCGDGPCRGELETLATQVCPGAVLFEGAVPHAEMPKKMKGAAVFVHGTQYESFGIALVEAMAAGLPVVAFAVGGIPEVVRDGQDGYLVPYGEVDTMAERIIELLRSPVRRQEMGRMGRQGSARFGWAAIASRWQDLYAGALTLPAATTAPSRREP